MNCCPNRDSFASGRNGIALSEIDDTSLKPNPELSGYGMPLTYINDEYSMHRIFGVPSTHCTWFRFVKPPGRYKAPLLFFQVGKHRWDHSHWALTIVAQDGN
jgi:hypothetical protein